jgi:hypothetical protein
LLAVAAGGLWSRLHEATRLRTEAAHVKENVT